MSKSPECQACKFYDDSALSYPAGGKVLCRIRPPISILVVSGPRSSWPEVKPTDWCGEYQFKEEKVV